MQKPTGCIQLFKKSATKIQNMVLIKSFKNYLVRFVPYFMQELKGLCNISQLLNSLLNLGHPV